MSSEDLPAYSPVAPGSPRDESPTIIDVDALDVDDTDVVYVGSARPSQRRRVGEDGRAVSVTSDVISITDSDEDNDIQFIGHNLPRPDAPPVRRSRIFSPPPPPQISGIPPVPEIPQRFRPRLPSGLVIPNEDPLPFEADLRAAPPAEQPIPIAAPPSHHIPSMGFGGALLAGVRRIMGPRSTSQRLERHNAWGVSGSFIMRWDALDFAGNGEEEDLLDGLDEIGFFSEEDNLLAAGRVRNQIERAFKQRDHEVQAEPDYKPEYTHPNRPLPGFTHDFCPPSSSSFPGEDGVCEADRASGSGTRSCEATLICAACRDPLVLGASDVGEDRARRKLWSLRCGHLVDGKCIAKLMEPAPLVLEASGSSSKPVECPPSPSQDTVVTADLDAGGMRSRLRPRRGMGSSSSQPTPSSGRRGASVKAPRSSRKGKGKMKAAVVDAEHEWGCPVSGCGRVHLSVRMDGRWTMDERRGAISVFV